MKKCRIPYENTCRMRVRNLSNISPCRLKRCPKNRCVPKPKFSMFSQNHQHLSKKYIEISSCIRGSKVEFKFIRAGRKHLKRSQGVGIAYFNMATRDVAGGKTPDMRPLIVYVLPYYLKTKSI